MEDCNIKIMNILIIRIHCSVGSSLAMALKNYYTLYGLYIISPSKEEVIKTFSCNL